VKVQLLLDELDDLQTTGSDLLGDATAVHIMAPSAKHRQDYARAIAAHQRHITAAHSAFAALRLEPRVRYLLSVLNAFHAKQKFAGGDRPEFVEEMVSRLASSGSNVSSSSAQLSAPMLQLSTALLHSLTTALKVSLSSASDSPSSGLMSQQPLYTVMLDSLIKSLELARPASLTYQVSTFRWTAGVLDWLMTLLESILRHPPLGFTAQQPVQTRAGTVDDGSFATVMRLARQVMHALRLLLLARGSVSAILRLVLLFDSVTQSAQPSPRSEWSQHVLQQACAPEVALLCSTMQRTDHVPYAELASSLDSESLLLSGSYPLLSAAAADSNSIKPASTVPSRSLVYTAFRCSSRDQSYSGAAADSLSTTLYSATAISSDGASLFIHSAERGLCKINMGSSSEPDRARATSTGALHRGRLPSDRLGEVMAQSPSFRKGEQGWLACVGDWLFYARCTDAALGSSSPGSNSDPVASSDSSASPVDPLAPHELLVLSSDTLAMIGRVALPASLPIKMPSPIVSDQQFLYVIYECSNTSVLPRNEAGSISQNSDSNEASSVFFVAQFDVSPAPAGLPSLTLNRTLALQGFDTTLPRCGSEDSSGRDPTCPECSQMCLYVGDVNRCPRCELMAVGHVRSETKRLSQTQPGACLSTVLALRSLLCTLLLMR